MASLHDTLRDAWQHRGLLARLLWPVSCVVAVLARLHRWWFEHGGGTPRHAPVPVIVVGNVVAGGAGKTPVVIALVEHLRHRGLKPGIVSRGYGRKNTRPSLVGTSSTADEVGDEPLLLSRRCQVPVAVAAHRYDAIQALLAFDPHLQVIVSDDGLQHHAIHHDVALCVFDDRGLGNGWMIPAGPLREPWPRQASPGVALFVVHTGKSSAIEGYHARRQLAAEAINGQGQRRPLRHWTAHPVSALAGIARPERFFDMLREQGLILASESPLPDHVDEDTLIASARSLDPSFDMLCTEKDAVKLWRAFPQAWAIPLMTELPQELLERIDQSLDAKLSSRHGHQTA